MNQTVILENDWTSCDIACQTLHALGVPFTVTHSGSVLTGRFHPGDVSLLILGLHTSPLNNLSMMTGLIPMFSGATILGLCPVLSSRERCSLLDVGFDALIERPFTMPELTATVQALFRRRLGVAVG